MLGLRHPRAAPRLTDCQTQLALHAQVRPHTQSCVPPANRPHGRGCGGGPRSAPIVEQPAVVHVLVAVGGRGGQHGAQHALALGRPLEEEARGRGQQREPHAHRLAAKVARQRLQQVRRVLRAALAVLHVESGVGLGRHRQASAASCRRPECESPVPGARRASAPPGCTRPRSAAGSLVVLDAAAGLVVSAASSDHASQCAAGACSVRSGEGGPLPGALPRSRGAPR